MAKKEWTDKERWDLAHKLFQITGADIDDDEEKALYDAISIISPEYWEAIEEREKEMEDFFDVIRVMDAIEKRKEKQN